MEIITTLIGQYAFPIAMCIYLLLQQAKDNNRHKEEIVAMAAAIDNNTKAIDRLIDHLNGR